MPDETVYEYGIEVLVTDYNFGAGAVLETQYVLPTQEKSLVAPSQILEFLENGQPLGFAITGEDEESEAAVVAVSTIIAGRTRNNEFGAALFCNVTIVGDRQEYPPTGQEDIYGILDNLGFEVEYVSGRAATGADGLWGILISGDN